MCLRFRMNFVYLTNKLMAGLHNIRPGRAFVIAENVATTQLRYILKCRSRISFKLQQNKVDFAARGKSVMVNLSF